MDDDKKSDGERRAEILAEAKKAHKNRIPTESDINADSIYIAFEKIEKLETEVKRILEHLGMKAKSK